MNTQDISLIKQVLATPEKLAMIRLWLKEQAGLTLLLFARFVCMQLRLVNPEGKFVAHTCARALELLDSEGLVSLGDTLRIGQKGSRSHNLTLQDEPVPPPVDVPDSVEKITDLRIVRAVTEADRQKWRRLFHDEHYLGERTPSGRLILYFIESKKHGILGGAAFSSAMAADAPRDEWLGWTSAVRDAYIDSVTNMSRFLIRECVECRNLASRALKMLLAATAADFMTVYGIHLLVAETFVDSEKFDGASYKAAGWELAGKTEGRGWGPKTPGDCEAPLSPKLVFMRAVDPDFRKRMGLSGEDPAPPWHVQGALPADDGLAGILEFYVKEFEQCRLGDRRRNASAARAAERMYASPAATVNGAAKGRRKDAKAMYRLFDAEDGAVTMESLFGGHVCRTCRRMMAHRIVFATIDATEYNYDSKPVTSRDMGEIGRNQASTARGLAQYATLVHTAGRVPLGILHVSLEARRFRERGAPRPSPNRPVEEKETNAWLEHARHVNQIAGWMPDTTVILLCDRGSDFYEFLREVTLLPNVHVILRAKVNREVVDGKDPLFQLLAGSDECARMVVKVPRQSERPKKRGQAARRERKAREAELSLSMREVTFRPPAWLKGGEKITLNAVAAVEMDPPKPAWEERVHWFLLTTLPLKSGGDAAACVENYMKRWTIEEWHRVVKHVCRIEDLALRELDRMKRVMAVKMIVAWSIMLRLKLGLKVDGLSPEDLFDDLEVGILRILALDMNLKVEDEGGGKGRPGQIETAKGAVRAVARIGGHQGRKCDGEPGFVNYAKGEAVLQSLKGFMEALRRHAVEALVLLFGPLSLAEVQEVIRRYYEVVGG